ncbi:MAG: anthranilate synthase component II [Thermodesulfobacteriota bacterium]
MKLVLIDNYDSFTYNLVQLFSQFPVDIVVWRNDVISLSDIEKAIPDGIIISPGPKTPAESGICKNLVRRFKDTCPILGVCLGMQIINEVFGGETVLAPRPVHGEKDRIFHNGEGILADLPTPFWAARYHSLTIRKRSEDIQVTAWNEENLVMGVTHRHYPIWGVQFHPESFMTEHGHEMAGNFLRLVKQSHA